MMTSGDIASEESGVIYGYSCLHDDVRSLDHIISADEAIEAAMQFYRSFPGDDDLNDLGPFEAKLVGRKWRLEAYPADFYSSPSLGGRRLVEVDAYSGCVLSSIIDK
ncbi:hypothetical protein ABAC460_03270 [Asticcacaulis sp. AC460]|nr:hypothetical protein ABAC460_03270 [Asticcacaulis sp. AC460]